MDKEHFKINTHKSYFSSFIVDFEQVFNNLNKELRMAKVLPKLAVQS